MKNLFPLTTNSCFKRKYSCLIWIAEPYKIYSKNYTQFDFLLNLKITYEAPSIIYRKQQIPITVNLLTHWSHKLLSINQTRSNKMFKLLWPTCAYSHLFTPHDTDPAVSHSQTSLACLQHQSMEDEGWQLKRIFPVHLDVVFGRMGS